MLKDRIIECMNEMDAMDLIHLHNEYCGEVNACDDGIYSMNDFNDLCAGQDADWIAARIYYGDFHYNDDYIRFNGYGNFVTFNDYSVKDNTHFDDIADYIAREMDSLYNDEIQAILDEHENAEVDA